MPVKTFADTSDKAIAITESNAATPEEFAALPDSERVMRYVPFQSESMAAMLEGTQSSAIAVNRRVREQKNTSGTATSGFQVEFGNTDFVNLLLECLQMGSWESVGSDGAQLLVDGTERKFLYVETRLRRYDDDNNPVNEFRQWFGNYLGEGTLALSGGDLATLNVSGTAVNYNLVDRQPAGTDENPGGGAGSEYQVFDNYTIMDGNNNLRNLQMFRIVDGAPATEIEAVFSSLNLNWQNNVRAQAALGHVFNAGLGRGKFTPQLSGTVYYDDESLEKIHFDNGRLFVTFTMEADDGTYVFIMPRASIQGPNANAGGENQDYTMDLTFDGMEGGFILADGVERMAALAIVRLPAGVDVSTVWTGPAAPVDPDPAP